MIDYCNAGFISAARKGATPEQNDVRHAALGAEMARYGLRFEEATGVYHGEWGRCYIVAADSSWEIKFILQLGRSFEQECVLITSRRQAVLSFMSGATKYVGLIAKTDDELRDHTRLSDGTILSVFP